MDGNNLTSRIITLENKLKEIKKAFQALKQQYEENNRILHNIYPKVGEKRKRYWIGI